MTYALAPRTIYTGESVCSDCALIIEEDRIDNILPIQQVPPHLPLKSIPDAIVAPGFIDLQANGFGGRLFNEDISIETLEVMGRTMLRYGTTHFLPTLISTTDDQIEQAISLVKEAKKAHPSILGIHIEGPYINKCRKGIHDESVIRPPDENMLKFMADHGGEIVKIITLAPEVVSSRQIALLKESGITVSAGHSMATYEEAIRGFDSGIEMATHLFNAMSPLSGRNPGLIGAIWERKNIVASVIADGIHVSWPNIRIAKRLKRENFCLITDAVSPAGTDLDAFMLNGKKMYHHKGKCLSEEGVLGGSALTLDRAVKNSVTHARFSLEESLKMASTYPARVIGMDHIIGKIKPGYKADLVLMNDDLEVIAAIDKGKFTSYAN